MTIIDVWFTTLYFIEEYIIGGSGAIDDPYVLSNQNIDKDMFDDRVREAMQPKINLQTDFSGVLVGSSVANQTNGAYGSIHMDAYGYYSAK